MRSGVALLAITAITAAGCGGGKNAHRITSDDLVAATFDDCREYGITIANYLLTGRTSDPEVEQHFAAERALLLEANPDARAGLARAAASDFIVACDDEEQKAVDETEAAAEAQRREAELAAEGQRRRLAEGAAAQRAWEVLKATAEETCTTAGGAFVAVIGSASVECTVTYGGVDYSVNYDDAGNLDRDSFEFEREWCEDEGESAASDRADGYPWARDPQFHPESGLCDGGQM